MCRIDLRSTTDLKLPGNQTILNNLQALEWKHLVRMIFYMKDGASTAYLAIGLADTIPILNLRLDKTTDNKFKVIELLSEPQNSSFQNENTPHRLLNSKTFW